MSARIASGVVGITLGILLVFGFGGVLFVPAIGILALIGVHEFYRGARQIGFQPAEWAGWLGCILLIGSRVWKPVEDTLLADLLLLFMITIALEIARPARAPIKNMGATVLGVAYVGGLFTFLVRLRAISIPQFNVLNLQSSWLDTGSYGAWLVLFLLLVTWACDTGAYFTGKFLGKRKLAPTISPGKTVEGAIGGVVSAMIVALLAGSLVAFPLVNRILVGAVIAATSIIGDLVESAMKREIGIKDFGSIMPGHGGVLDRFDSLLFSAPALFYIVWLCYLTRSFGD
jgi:phosphatidate cytidylyltransferase